jgi:hypothetical protein
MISTLAEKQGKVLVQFLFPTCKEVLNSVFVIGIKKLTKGYGIYDYYFQGEVQGMYTHPHRKDFVPLSLAQATGAGTGGSCRGCTSIPHRNDFVPCICKLL